MFGFKARRKAKQDEQAQSAYLKETFDYTMARRSFHIGRGLSPGDAENKANKECRAVYPVDFVGDYLDAGLTLRSGLSAEQFGASPAEDAARVKREDEENGFWGSGFFSDWDGQRATPPMQRVRRRPF